MPFVARIKPYDPRKGQVARSYAHQGLNRRFVEGMIYTDLTEDVAAELRRIQQPRAGRGAMFDVGTPEEMNEILAGEAAAKLGVNRATAVSVVLPAPLASGASVPIEQLPHTDIAGVRVRHTQEAPPEPAPEKPTATPTKGPRRRGGEK